MIHKIERLISIGKFKNYLATGDVAFKKLTLIYGDNGSGKTTLTSLLRSLTQNKPCLVKRRKSINQTTQQAAQIVQRNISGDTHHTFNPTTGWTAPFPDIEIFDIHFVDENIYSGFDFNEEHKKHLHQFVIGAQGIAIQQQIERNKTDKTTSRQLQTNIGQQLIQQVGNNLTPDLITSFLAIPQANNIDQLIATAEAALVSANANSVIQTLQPLSQLVRINSGIDFNSLITDLQTTSQAIQNTALQTLFSNHCQDLADNSIDGPENWLQKGFAYIESKQATANDNNPITLSCPFCKQTIDNTIEIINAYAFQFNAAFNSLIQRIQAHLTTFQAFNLETAIQAFNNVNQINTGRIASWTAHLPNTVQSPTFSIIADEANLRAEFQALVATVQQKLQNPSAVVATATATDFQSSLQTINTNIDSYNQSINTYNNAITTFRASIRTVVNAQLEVDRLKRIKKRFETPIVVLCNQLTTERQNLRTLETAYPLLVQQQQTAVTTFFNSYKTRINHYLGTVFKTPFRIDDVVHVPPRGMATQSKIGYKLTIEGQDISFEPSQPNSVKDCLSEGDRSTIALAFFLSKLDIDPNVNNKVLVFDDPLSSFDSNRRMYTVQLIKDLFPNIKQVIVLSHNEFFLHELSKGFAPGDKKTLRITEDFTARASVIEPLVLETLVENDYFRHIKELENFLRHPDLSKKEIVLGWLRNVLEAHIRFKFYRQISALPPNDQTLGRLITALINQGVVFRNNANRTTIISMLNLINGISCRPHHGEPIPDYTILGANPNTMNRTELSNFVTDTLNLIDNEL
ncbi:MAG: AAA family ATPase [Bacteroidetes bacterium]|nr:AAA family ATPase [Bacteroidota bacterium]